MRFISFLTTLLITLLLASCGGGGGSPGLSSGPVSAFSVAAPTALTLQVGLTQQYVIQGGAKPYTVFSTNPAVAVGWLIGENVFAVGTTAPGTATVTVLDAKGSKFDIAIKAGSSTAFFTTADPILNLEPGVPQTYTIGGGTPPYTATSSFPSLVAVKVDGNRLILTADHIDATNSATISILDAAGAKLSSVVKVTTTELKLTPGSADSATIFQGDTMNLIITGGTPPYRIVPPIDGVFDAKIVNGNQVQMIGNRIADGVQVNVVDANNQSTAGPKVKIVAGQDTLRISPVALTIPENTNSPNILLNVYGVAPGSSLQVFTTDNTLLIPGTPVKANASGSTYTITLSAGNTCSLTPSGVGVVPVIAGGTRTVTISVLDSTGSRGTSTITVTDTDANPGCSR